MSGPPKSNRKILGIPLPSRLRRQPSPQPRAGLSSNQTPDTKLNQSPQPAPAPSSNLQSTDLQKSQTRYVEAYDALRKAITNDNSLNTVFNGLAADPEGIDDSFINKLHGALESQNSKVKDRSAWGTCKSMVKYLMHTFKPFAKNFLTIAIQASAVYYLPTLSDIVDSYFEPIWFNM
jgi:hypothetical protein